MDETLRRLNGKRLKCLAYLAPAATAFCLAAVSLYYAVSPSVHLGFLLPFGFFIAFSAVFAYTAARFKKNELAYIVDYRTSAVPASLADEFPEGTQDGRQLTSGDLAETGILNCAEKTVLTENFSAVYEDTAFAVAYAETGELFRGWFFRFTFGAEFRKIARVRQKGFTGATKITGLSTDGVDFNRYETGNLVFDNAFVAAAASEADCKALLTEPVLQPFLKIRENCKAKTAAYFYGDKLYLLLQNPKREFAAPLFFEIKKEKFKKEALTEIFLALSLAADIGLEKKIWKKRGA